MVPSFCALFFLGLSSLATAVNFTQVFEWPDDWDYEWPSERDGTFKPQNIQPIYMDVYGTRIFLSLDRYYNGIPVTLVSLPTSSASSASPRLTPFPSWKMQEYGNCNKIEEAKGLEVDSDGRLWVLDDGSKNCNAKIWIIDLINNDQTKLIHRFSFLGFMFDLVLDETPNGTFAYITRWDEQNIVVFGLERNQSWIVDTPGINFLSIALSPKSKEEPRQLYLGKYFSNELFSIPVGALRNGTRTANLKLIGKWTTRSYRTLMDNHGTIYTAFLYENYTSSWNTSQPFQELRFHQDTGLKTKRPFTFAIDQSGFLWMTVFEEYRKPKYRLLKAAVGAKSYIFEVSSQELDGASGAEENVAKSRTLINSSVFFVFILAMATSFVILLAG